MLEKQQRHIIDIFFVIALFCLFALSAIFLISIGADIYGKTVTNMEDNFNTRTALAYVTEKVRQSDKDGQISVGQIEDLPALVITESSTGSSYQTYLYAYEGHLKELMCKSDLILGPEAGQDILSVSDFTLAPVNDDLLKCTISLSSKESYVLYISIHAGGLMHHE